MLIRAAILSIAALLIAAGQVASPGAAPASGPSDPTMEWLLSRSTTLPATRASPEVTDLTTQPSVLQALNVPAERARPGVVTLSDGKTIAASLSTTLRQPFHIWIEGEKRFEDAPFSLVASMEVKVTSETQEREWNFAASGSDVKVYSGKTYPVRETIYVFTMKDGSTFTGGVAAPIYVDEKMGRSAYLLRKRDKGDVGQSLKDLVYVVSVRFSD